MHRFCCRVTLVFISYHSQRIIILLLVVIVTKLRSGGAGSLGAGGK